MNEQSTRVSSCNNCGSWEVLYPDDCQECTAQWYLEHENDIMLKSLLDVPAIEKQLETIISERLRWCDYCNDEVTDKHLAEIDDLTKSAVAEIKVLFGLENKETDGE